MQQDRTKKNTVLFAVMVLLSIICLIPFYYIIVNSFKSMNEITVNISALPHTALFSNYANAWKTINFPRAFFNTLFITVFANIGTVICTSMAGYRLARSRTRFNRFLYAFFIASMSIPFQIIMIPMVKIGKVLNFNNSIVGVTIVYIGLSIPFATFMCYSGMKSIPIEIEEAARIDGCNSFRLFWKVVFPLMKSTVTTFVVLNTFWYWNDYLLPQLMLQRSDVRTLQVAINALFGEYLVQWNLILPAIILAILPIMIFFLIMQKNVVAGLASGAVKG